MGCSHEIEETRGCPRLSQWLDKVTMESTEVALDISCQFGQSNEVLTRVVTKVVTGNGITAGRSRQLFGCVYTLVVTCRPMGAGVATCEPVRSSVAILELVGRYF